MVHMDSTDQTAPPPPPQTGAQPFVRAKDNRIVAGVCAGLAKATNTDPILFRVILAVLVFFGGIGAVLYLIAWLLLPAEDESASPVEALIGRGESSTSPVVTVLLGVLTVLGLALSMNSGFSNVALFAVIVVGVILLLRRDGGLPESLAGLRRHVSPTPPPPSSPPPTPPAPTPQSQTVTDAFTPQTEPAMPSTPPDGDTDVLPTQPASPAASRPTALTATPPPPTMPPPPPAPQFAPPPVPPPPTQQSFRPPFAPHGPYARPVRPVRPPRPPRERSALGQITFSLMCLALGGLAVIDVAGANVSFTAYVGTALAMTAAGLLVGSWLGRARWLIPVGIILSLALGAGYGAERVTDEFGENPVRVMTVTPTSIEEIQQGYEWAAGDITLDLRGLDFANQDLSVPVHLGAGDLEILLPPTVDVTAIADVGVGDSNIFGTSRDGVGMSSRTTDLGSDGAGGGTLELTITLGAGDLQVTR